jgi:hypothetical protein
MSVFVLPSVPSERLGFIPEGLDRLNMAMQRQIDEKKAPGPSMLISRHGNLRSGNASASSARGAADVAIFRIYIVSVEPP